MAVRRGTARTSSNNSKVNGTIFFHEGFYGTKASMRVAAKRFVLSEQYDAEYHYDAELIDRKWQFTPAFKRPGSKV